MVIDPGLMEAGGHHAALLETLCESEKEDVKLSVFSHEHLDSALASKARSAKIEIVKHFKTNFYQHYDNGFQLKLSGLQQYIRHLAAEYLQVFKLVTEKNSQEKMVFFYPCLNWEHASSLSLALSFMQSELPIVHKVCCMFTPADRCDSNSFYYRMGFSTLSKFRNVKLYATDWETKEYYSSLNIPTKGYHPCYLLNWDEATVKRSKSQKTPHFLLYMGDAKENKGFTRLPELVESYIKRYEGNVDLTIQYTLAWDYPELAASISQLLLLNEKYEQLNLHNFFWEAPDLVNAFQEFTGFVCTYSPLTYKNKSSGLTWLAAYFNLHVVVSESCWIVRELDRLGSSYTISNSLFIEPRSVENSTRDSIYYQNLFTNLIKWLKE
ncbi:hypothetical protein [Alteromonas sp. BMJM2]|uniref:hypothetical protein n=1 Tax=Alteromonas sp. BMJM2 TaxID=2954241 RepID=UPI0022B4E222|nr:hypothetical protein [Alteromonas sp. BMJM2]